MLLKLLANILYIYMHVKYVGTVTDANIAAWVKDLKTNLSNSSCKYA